MRVVNIAQDSTVGECERAHRPKEVDEIGAIWEKCFFLRKVYFLFLVLCWETRYHEIELPLRWMTMFDRNRKVIHNDRISLSTFNICVDFCSVQGEGNLILSSRIHHFAPVEWHWHFTLPCHRLSLFYEHREPYSNESEKRKENIERKQMKKMTRLLEISVKKRRDNKQREKWGDF